MTNLELRSLVDNLVTEDDITHDLHIHSSWSGDGVNSVQEIIDCARKRDLNIIAITDHAKNLPIVAVKDFKAYVADVRKCAILNPDIHVLCGIECNIAKDGTLDYTDKELSQLDLVISSIHSSFELSKEEQTYRLIKAIQNPHTTIIGHCTGEDYGVRQAMDIDWEKVFQACVECNVAIEINAIPSRLGLNPQLLWIAKGMGIKFCFASDAHCCNVFSSSDLNDNPLLTSLYRMRRGGIEKGDLLIV